MDDLKNLKFACNKLNGFRSWSVKLVEDNYKPSDPGYEAPDNLFASKSRTSLNQSCASSNGNVEEMEEECFFAGDYVDVHGNQVEVLQGENGVLYVNLNDVRSAGYNIYKRASFENAVITKDDDLRQLELYLINQAKKYILDTKKTFNEDDMVEMMERVKEKVLRKSTGEFGEGRTINTSPNTKNFSITKSNVPSASPASSSRPPMELADNFRPSFSHVKPKPKNLDDRQDGPSPASNGPRRSYDNRNDSRNEDRRKTFDNSNLAVTEVTSSQPEMRKPRTKVENVEATKSTRSEALADKNADEEPEKTWEGDKTNVPKSKPPSEALSVGSERGGRKENMDIERTLLVPNGVYTIKVSYTKAEKRSLFYAQWKENLNQIEEILLHVNTEDLKLPEIAAPARGMLCIAYFEDCWYRAVVLKGKSSEGGPFVELIDYGNKEVIKTPLRGMSEAMKQIPGMAIRIAAHYNQESEALTLNTEQELEVFVRKHLADEYDDLTHLVDIKRVLDGPKLDQDPPTPPSEVSSDQEQQQKSVGKKAVSATGEDCFTEIPPSTARIINGEYVMIVSYTETKFIFRNRETATNCKEIYNHLRNMEKKPIANPQVGQLVICSRDGLEGFHRAVIKKIINQMAEIEYLDHDGGETLTLKSLRNMDKSLAEYPVAKLESPKIDWLQKVTEKSDLFLNSLIQDKKKLQVVLNGSKLDLLLAEGGKTVPLSQKIEELENPRKEASVEPVAKAAPVKSTEPPIVAQSMPRKEKVAQETVKDADQYVKMSFDDMPFVKAELGENDYICYNCKDGSVTLLSSADAGKYIDHIDDLQPTDTIPHEPEPWDMCLGKFEDIWYRAIITETDGDTFDVLFVDFGNTETLSKNDLRKFPKKLADIPILAIGAYFMDIPDDPKVHERLQQLIPDETLLRVNVKTDLNDVLKHGIVVPSIYEVLRKEKLI